MQTKQNKKFDGLKTSDSEDYFKEEYMLLKNCIK